MHSNSFENYGRRARLGITSTEMSGRYPSQEVAERRILFDVANKLDIGPEDSVLDIGCGVGLLSGPLSHVVASVTGVDHPGVVDVLRARCPGVEVIPGDFRELDLGARRFTKIVMYGVVQNLPDEGEVVSFLRKALDHLHPGGRLLVGDLPNVDKKRRFQSTEFGADFEAMWARHDGSASMIDENDLLPESRRIEFTDAIVASVFQQVRGWGYDAFVLPQPEHLPWGFTREDLLICSTERPV